jgi:DNA repair protein RadC
LGDNELLALLFVHGTPKMNALAVANELLSTSDGLHGLMRLTLEELVRTPGIGPTRAAQIMAAIELGRRTLLQRPRPRLPIGCPRDMALHLIPLYGCRAVEQFGVVLLDTKRRVLRTSIISVGTLDSSLVHPREVFREAAGASASAIVLFHNHPSGDPEPSRDDEEITRRLVDAGSLMGIEILDHIVITDTRYCSFKESGRL